MWFTIPPRYTSLLISTANKHRHENSRKTKSFQNVEWQAYSRGSRAKCFTEKRKGLWDI